jgi:hypothetical protein
MDADPDSDLDADPVPSIFVIDLQGANKKLILFSAYCFLKAQSFTSFSKDKKLKRSKKKQYESRFFLLFLLGDRRPKNMRIRRIRNRIRNTDCRVTSFRRGR